MARIPKAKPCPFCGSRSVFVECMDTVVYRAWCDGCAALGPPVEHGDYGDGRDLETRDAIRAWNGRKKAPSPTPDTPKDRALSSTEGSGAC